MSEASFPLPRPVAKIQGEVAISGAPFFCLLFFGKTKKSESAPAGDDTGGWTTKIPNPYSILNASNAGFPSGYSGFIPSSTRSKISATIKFRCDLESAGTTYQGASGVAVALMAAS